MEHDRVFVIDAVKRPAEPLEEDRIWYTAVTRAKKELHVIPIVGERNWFTPRVAPKEEEVRVEELPTFSLSSIALQNTSLIQPAGSFRGSPSARLRTRNSLQQLGFDLPLQRRPAERSSSTLPACN